MPTPIEICLEELDPATDDAGFIRCVALSGGEPGLALDRGGEVRWMQDRPEAYGLWVSADERLVLHRAAGAEPLTVERGSRSVVAPVGQPVILRDQDVLILGALRLRVHVHGVTEAVHAPERLPRSAFGRLVRAAAAAATLTLGATVATGADAGPSAAGGTSPPIEVRSRPPSVAAATPLLCTITRQQVTARRTLELHATCPAVAGLHVGAYGNLIDPKTRAPMPGVMVEVKKITGKQIVVEAPKLSKAVPSTQIRFMVPTY